MHHGGVARRAPLIVLTIVVLVGCSSTPEDPGLGYLQEGEAALAEGDTERAVAAYQLALSSAEGDQRAMRGLLASQVANGDAESALETLSWIEDEGSEPVDPCPALSLATRDRLERGALIRAESSARHSLEAGCSGARGRVARVLVRRAGAARSTEPAAALRLYEEAIALDPSRPEPFLDAGLLLIEEGDPDESVALIARGLTHHPDDRELRDLMVRALSIR
jgi:tetratricopeptide (TPR) repeat protein